MQRIDVFNRVREIIAAELGVSEERVTEAAFIMDDLGADSLDTAGIVVALENEFLEEVSDQEWDRMFTVKDWVELFCEKMGVTS